MNLSFSRYFPVYHPRKGERTYFIEKIWSNLLAQRIPLEHIGAFGPGYQAIQPCEYTELESVHRDRQKLHTIRLGNRWKPGMRFTPVCWSGKPYNSKVFQFAPEMEVKKVWNFLIQDKSFFLNGEKFLNSANPEFGSYSKLEEIAKNDGLTLEDFLLWFRYPKYFSGQIICWSDAISY